MKQLLAILGIGTALPSQSMAQREAMELAKTLSCRTEKEAQMLETLYQHTRIRKRGSVLLTRGDESGPRQSFFLPAEGERDRGPTTEERMQRYREEAAPLALAAAKRALIDSHEEVSQISHLITVSCTGFVAPGFDIALIKELGLKQTIGRTHLGFMGCHGVLNGLRVASALGRASPRARVLLCAVELCSLHFSYEFDSGKVVANGLFADGAGALIGASQGEERLNTWKVKASGSSIFPASEDAMTWRIGNHGFEMTLSSRVPHLLATYLRPWLEEWLAQNGFHLSEIRSWAIHPGGPRLLETVAACLNLPEEMTAVSREILTEYGNMSSATILFILECLRSKGVPRPCLALGFGPGLAVETALLT